MSNAIAKECPVRIDEVPVLGAAIKEKLSACDYL
jgi:hypothetical protein